MGVTPHQRLSSHGAPASGAAHGLDVVAAGVDQKAAIVRGAVAGPRAGLAVVGGPGGEALCVEGVHGLVAGGPEGDVRCGLRLVSRRCGGVGQGGGGAQRSGCRRVP